MSAVADAMEAARDEIFIADWWLSPEIHMKRPALHGDYWRLDHIIRRKAEAGVKIFLLLYKEVEIALGINSFYSKQTIGKCHPENVKVNNFPIFIIRVCFLWAHHEKLVVVDRVWLLSGALTSLRPDGRSSPRLTDLGSIKHRDSVAVIEGVATSPAEQSSIVSLVKMTNSLSVGVVKLSNQSDPDKIENDVKNAADVDIKGEVNGNITSEPGPENYKGNTPEMQRKTILSKVKENVRNRGREWKTFLFTSDEDDDDDDDKADDDKEKTLDDKRSDVITDDGTDCGSRITQQTTDIGDGLVEEGGRGMEGTDAALKGLEGLSGSAKLWYGKDYTNFIVKDFDNLDLPFQDLVDRSQTPRMPWHDVGAMVVGAPARDVARHFIERWNAIKLEKAKTNPCYPYLLPKSYQNLVTDFEFITTRTYQVSCQVVRSISQWSGGFLDGDTWEASIHEAYVDVIGRARHFVYIENQFFITALSAAASQVRNQVADALYKRILRAHRERKTFRVYVVIPLLPGFEGEVGTPTGTALHAITHWNYASISRGKDSLISRLKAAGVSQPDDYISFHGLRTHSVLNGKLVTELIYVHSKLLIADDRVAIIGSANINDRSLLGKRDSEIAVVIQVFQCIPSDKVTCFAALQHLQYETPLSQADPDTAVQLLQNVKGHLVMLPLEFLCNEVLTPNPNTVTGMMPTSLWT
ncbi:hypothetical protein LSTR_LSTR008596 [Laodelphax striatellus]|uniref:phospholipase D n=1 Tax=Laodelphax striatellus TaxID=195883 RepID=A0A482X8T1_LAOST|nr:hypothetical protein LSTR_LSTR008596 [Laodelphax striatellus]